jgi:hypothetical protein
VTEPGLRTGHEPKILENISGFLSKKNAPSSSGFSRVVFLVWQRKTKSALMKHKMEKQDHTNVEINMGTYLDENITPVKYGEPKIKVSQQFRKKRKKKKKKKKTCQVADAHVARV